MKLVLNLLSIFAAPAIAAVLGSASFGIICWAAGTPITHNDLEGVVCASAITAFIGNGIRILIHYINLDDD